MKLHRMAVAAVLLAGHTMAQSLPDEINYPPYLERLRTIEAQVRNVEAQITSLNQNIAEARRFVVESEAYIRQQQAIIAQNDAQIADHRGTIPQLQREIQNRRSQIADLERDRQSLDAELQRLRSQDQQLRVQLRPLEESLGRRQESIRRMELELGQFQREEASANQRIQSIAERMRQLEVQIDRERAEQANLRRDQGQIEGRIQQLQQNINANDAQISQTQNGLRSEEGRLTSLNDQVRQAQAELEALRRQGPSPQQLQAAEQRVREATQQRDQAANAVNSLRAEIGRIQGQISSLRAQQQSLRDQIANLEPRIAQIRGQISSLEASVRTQENNLRLEEAKLGQLNERVRESQAELDNLRSSGAPQEQITAAERKLRAQTAKRDEVAASIPNLRSEISKTEAQISSLEQQIEQLRRDVPRWEAQIGQLASQISSHESSLSSQQNNLRSEEARLDAANDRVRQAQAELEAIRRQGPSAEQLAAAEARVRQATQARDAVANNIEDLRRDLARLQSAVTQLRAQLETERRNQAALPARIAQSENQERELVNRRAGANQELNQAQGELVAAQRRSQTRIEQIRQLQAEMRNDELQAERLRTGIANLDRDMNRNRTQEANLRESIALLNGEAMELAQEERERTAAIPQLEAANRQARTDITQSQNEIAQARTEEAKLLKALAEAQARLAQNEADERNAQGQYDARQSLYNRYLGEARSVGTSQVTTASDLGAKAGAALATSKATEVGQSIGKELGGAEGKLWALIRGEVIGYPKGYEAGHRSVDDINRASALASKKATDAAEAFAQANLKPDFFHQHYLTELKRPVEKEDAMESQLVSLKRAKSRTIIADLLAGVDPVTAQEISQSNSIATSLDSQIKTSTAQVKELVQKQQSLAKPEIVYVAPTSVPFGQVSCANVYENLQVYKDACLAAYREQFRDVYLSSANARFSSDYPGQYATEARRLQLDTQAVQFDLTHPGFLKVAENEGLAKGKEDVYNETFSAVYARVYQEQLPLATDRANAQAEVEAKEWVAANAAVTLDGHALSRKAIRGGDTVKLSLKLKNVSPKDSNSVMLFKVGKVTNVSLPRLEYAQNGAKANSITINEDIIFTVPTSARSGEKIGFELEALLPGHRYVSARKELLKVEKTLVANPKLEVKAEYDSTPNIRIIRFKTHTLNFALKPVVEDIVDGYEVELALGEGKEFINLAPSVQASGALKLGEQKTLSYTYSFKKEAKGKKVQLKVLVRYLGEVISETAVDMVPK